MRAIWCPRLSSHADCLPGVLRDAPWQQGEEGEEGHWGAQVTIVYSFYRTKEHTTTNIQQKKQRNANDKNLGGAKMEEEKTIFLFCSKSPHPHWAVHSVADSKSLVVHLFGAKKRCSLDSTCSEDFVSAAGKMYLINLQNVFVPLTNTFFCFQNIIYK